MSAEPADLPAAQRRVREVVEGTGLGEDAEGVQLRLAQGLLQRGNHPQASVPVPHFGVEQEVAMAALLRELDTLALAEPLALRTSRSQLPGLGRLLDLLKAPFHQLSLYYVRRLAERQAMHNERTRLLLSLLVEAVGRLEEAALPPRGQPGDEGKQA